VLVAASEPISTDRLRAALGGTSDDAEIIVVAPALHRPELPFWLSNADEAIRRAELVQRETVAGLDDVRWDAHGDTGESDPVKAVEDVLLTFPAERIVLLHSPQPGTALRPRGSTRTHCSSGLASQTSEPNQRSEPLSARCRCEMPMVSHR
jgi:hypothetical protein